MLGTSTLEPAEQKLTLGWREWVRLDTLDLPPIKAKIDTGARTSTLHAFRVQAFHRDGAEWVRFSIHPLQRNRDLVCRCEAPVIDRRRVSDSGGHRQMRYVIQSDVTLGPHIWPIELTLTSRETMLFRLLLGRTALAGRFLVDPSRSYCIGRRPPKNPSAALAPATPVSHLETRMSITIFHNPRCSKSRATLQLLQDKGVTPTVVEYLKATPTVEELDRILQLLGIEPRDLMRKGESVYKEAGLDNPTLDRDTLIAAMVKHPILIERPIVIANGKAVIGRPPEKVLEVL